MVAQSQKFSSGDIEVVCSRRSRFLTLRRSRSFSLTSRTRAAQPRPQLPSVASALRICSPPRERRRSSSDRRLRWRLSLRSFLRMKYRPTAAHTRPRGVMSSFKTTCKRPKNGKTRIKTQTNGKFTFSFSKITNPRYKN